MTGAKGELLKELVQQFNSLPPNLDKIVVHAQFVGNYDEGLNKLRSAVLAGSEPHIAQITDVGSQVMIDSDRIVPLQDLIDHDPTFPLAQILPPIRHYYEFKGRLYSLPFATSNPVLFYNLDAFKTAGISKAPQTFAELEADAKRLTNKALRVTGLTWPLHAWFFEEFVAEQGAPLVNAENGRSGRASEAEYLSSEALNFMNLWRRMVVDGTFSNVGRGWDPAEQNFLAARAMMFVTSTSDVFEILKQAPFHVGVANIPGATFPPKGGTIVGGNSLWIMKNKAEPEKKAAFEFIKYMASAAVQENWHIHTGYFPIRQDVIDALKAKGFYQKYPEAWTAIEQLQSSPDLPATRGALLGAFAEAREQLMTATEEILSEKLSVQEALKKAKLKTDNSLQRYNQGVR